MGKDGVDVSAESLRGKVVALYFSAHWCGPCRAFTPQLASIYAGAASAGHALEIIFVSADRDVDAFQTYFAQQPWLAVKFSHAELRQRLNEQYGVNAVPTLIVLNADGCVLTKDGRGDIARLGDAAIPQWLSKAASH